jgi:hypothetical protein
VEAPGAGEAFTAAVAVRAAHGQTGEASDQRGVAPSADERRAHVRGHWSRIRLICRIAALGAGVVPAGDRIAVLLPGVEELGAELHGGEDGWLHGYLPVGALGIVVLSR